MATKLCKLGLPQALSSTIVILSFFATLAVVISLLYGPAQQWIKSAPESLVKVQNNFRSLAEPLTTIDRADETLNEATSAIQAEPTEVVVSVEKPSMVSKSMLINQTVEILVFVAVIAILTFFMLSTGDDLLNRILACMPVEQRGGVLTKIGDIQHSVGRYLGQITCINLVLGVVVTGVMWLVDMPTPVLWGVLATLFNFVPYVGPLAATAIVFVAAASSFDTIGRAAGVAIMFWSITAVEGQLVTPTILGKTLKVGPVIVLVAIAFWGFLWGLPGVFLAVPLLIVLRKIFSSFDATHALAVILGDEPRCEAEAECEAIEKGEFITEAQAATN